MIVECQFCHAKYNVDENKVPPTGVRVRCHKCQNILLIQKLEPPSKPSVVEAPPKPTEMPQPPLEEKKPPEPEMPPPPPEVTRPFIPETPFAQQKPVEVPEKPKPTPTPAMSEEDKKWHERAKRLAKALASDLVLYNQDKVEQGFKDGTLVQLLGPEIRRSWEYYCQQIPKHIVEATDYFREQLNKIVGKGKEIFK